MKNKRNKDTFFNRLLFRINAKKVIRKMTNFKLNEFYCELLRNKHKTTQPLWKYRVSMEVVLKEKQQRDKSKLTTKRFCGRS